VKTDLQNWYRKLKPRGWLFCDDYDPDHWPGVVRAIDEFGLKGRPIVPRLWCSRR
jgi:hypothetical protein